MKKGGFPIGVEQVPAEKPYTFTKVIGSMEFGSLPAREGGGRMGREAGGEKNGCLPHIGVLQADRRWRVRDGRCQTEHQQQGKCNPKSIFEGGSFAHSEICPGCFGGVPAEPFLKIAQKNVFVKGKQMNEWRGNRAIAAAGAGDPAAHIHLNPNVGRISAINAAGGSLRSG